MPCDHVITICNLVYWLPQKDNGKARSEGCKQMDVGFDVQYPSVPRDLSSPPPPQQAEILPCSGETRSQIWQKGQHSKPMVFTSDFARLESIPPP